MTLQSASTANANSITNAPDYTDVFDSPAGNTIDEEITAQTGLGLFVATLYFDRIYSDHLTQIKQSNGAYILLSKVLSALESKGYRPVQRELNSTRLKLTLAWGGE